MAKHKKLSIVVFEPKWAKNNKVDKRHPLKYGEVVLYLGDIVNCPGHCCVVKYSGESIWMVHTEDFRTGTEDEV